MVQPLQRPLVAKVSGQMVYGRIVVRQNVLAVAGKLAVNLLK